jgi:hypothetical protein
MATRSFFPFAGLSLLALSACADLENSTAPQTVERKGAQTADNRCDLGDYKVYRPIPRDGKGLDSKPSKAPYDAVIPPTYDAPSQLPSGCSDKLGK